MISYRDKIEQRVPSDPSVVYDAWVNWKSFLDRKSLFLTFKEARKEARKFKVGTYLEWLELNRSGKRPKNIPANPCVTFKDDWKGWVDWLGTKNRKRRSRKKQSK